MYLSTHFSRKTTQKRCFYVRISISKSFLRFMTLPNFNFHTLFIIHDSAEFQFPYVFYHSWLCRISISIRFLSFVTLPNLNFRMSFIIPDSHESLFPYVIYHTWLSWILFSKSCLEYINLMNPHNGFSIWSLVSLIFHCCTLTTNQHQPKNRPLK